MIGVKYFKAGLRIHEILIGIHEILIRIRMQIRIHRPLLRLMDPDADPDPAIFVSDLQDVKKKNVLSYFAFYFSKVPFHNFLKIKRYKEVTKQ
jgi:hypothetical protein